jgi:hypothetical protein
LKTPDKVGKRVNTPAHNTWVYCTRGQRGFVEKREEEIRNSNDTGVSPIKRDVVVDLNKKWVMKNNIDRNNKSGKFEKETLCKPLLLRKSGLF